MSPTQITRRPVEVPAGHLRLPGDLITPAPALGLVLFAHGSGSSRLSPRNQAVAHQLHTNRIGTLLFDLLTEEESRDRSAVFDLPLLADRLLAATGWIAGEPEGRLPLGYFGASTGAGAALMAAATSPHPIHAVVSRGGRPDLAGDWLPRVQAPTLLIVGSRDPVVLALNQAALERLRCPRSLEIVAGATHLFEEPGTLEQVSHLACDWFARYLGAPALPNQVASEPNRAAGGTAGGARPAAGY
jgi:putative phosphoribosyl transferase